MAAHASETAEHRHTSGPGAALNTGVHEGHHHTSVFDNPDASGTARTGAAAKHGWFKVVPLVVVVLTVAVLSYVLPVNDLIIEPLGNFLDSLHPLGAAALFAAVYVVAVSCFVPRPVMAGLAGFLFGFPLGLLIESPCSLIGASTFFVVSKTILRKQVLAMIHHNPKYQAVDDAIEVKGPYLCIMIRLSPLFPYPINNFVISSTSMRYLTYIWSSWCGLIPYSVLYTLIGSSVKDIDRLAEEVTSGGSFGVAQFILLAFGIIATIALIILLSRWSKRAVEQAVAEVEAAKQDAEAAAAAEEARARAEPGDPATTGDGSTPDPVAAESASGVDADPGSGDAAASAGAKSPSAVLPSFDSPPPAAEPATSEDYGASALPDQPAADAPSDVKDDASPIDGDEVVPVDL